MRNYGRIKIVRQPVQQAPKVFPHWKVQYYDPMTLCWRDLPKICLTLNEAELIAKRLMTPKVRFVRIDRDKRTLLHEIKK